MGGMTPSLIQLQWRKSKLREGGCSDDDGLELILIFRFYFDSMLSGCQSEYITALAVYICHPYHTDIFVIFDKRMRIQKLVR